MNLPSVSDPTSADMHTSFVQRVEDRALTGEPEDCERPRRSRVFPFLALVLCGTFAILQLSKWPNRLRYPGEEDAAEGTQLTEMVHLRRGVHIYRMPSAGEFDGAVYGPLCYLLGSAVINSDHPSYLPLRLLSLVATLGLSAAAAFFVLSVTKSRLGAVTASLLLLGSAYIGRYGISARADMVALLLAFSGFLVFFRYRDSQPALAVSACLMLLSFFYKQQFIGAPLSVLCYLLITRRFRSLRIFAGILLFGALALVAVFTFLVFPHQSFWLHFIEFNRLPFDKSIIVPEILMFLIPLFVPLLGSADFVDSHSDTLIACYAAISSAGYFLLLFSSGSGADTNRCLEAVVVLSCLVVCRITTAKRLFSGLAWTTALAFSLILVMLMRSAFVVPEVRAQDFAADADLQSYLRQHFSPGTPVLAYYPADPLRAGLAAPVTNWWHYSALVRKGVFSDQDVVSRIDRGGYGAILMDFDLADSTPERMADFYTTPSVRQAVLHRYQQTARLVMPAPELTRFSNGHIYVWVPQPTPQPRQEREEIHDLPR